MLVGALARPANAAAQGIADQIAIHGFASWAYGRTDGNNYLNGTEKGNYRDGNLAINIAASLSEKLRIVAQPSVTQAAAAEAGEPATTIAIDYAFAAWKFSDAAELRLGKVQQPFGLYAEIFQVGTLRPLYSLPQSIYGSSGIVAQGLTGVSLTASTSASAPWGVTADLYGGGVDLQEFGAPLDINRGDTLSGLQSIETEVNRDVIGGRLVLHTPVSGLTLGGSAWTGVATEGSETNRNTVFGAEAEYLSDRWSIRGEYAYNKEGDKYHTNAGYGEVGFRLTPAWQVAGRYERFVNTLPGFPSPAVPSLTEHTAWVGGLSYWFSPNLVVRANYTYVKGNRFATPDVDEILADIGSGSLDDQTNLVQFGVQFSF
jgi:opacity protein-like surface antigen